MANTTDLPLRKALESWCKGELLEGANFMSKEVGDTTFIWVEPVSLGNDKLFPSYFAGIGALLEALKAQPERHISEAIISTPKHYLRLLTDTSNLLPANQQPCLVLHKTLDESTEKNTVEQKVYSQQELDKRFSQKAKDANSLLNKQQWAFKQQGVALFFNGEVESGSQSKAEGAE